MIPRADISSNMHTPNFRAYSEAWQIQNRLERTWKLMQLEL